MARDAQPITVDFETEAIEARPHYPPKPVGVAIKYPGRKAKYLAWGHPTKNNTTKEKAGEELRDIWKRTLLFHNGKFDLDVAETHFGLPFPAWDKYHDTLFQLFLDNPHARSLSLKPASEAILGMPPEEANALHDWLVGAGVVRRGAKTWGAHIARAPGDIVGTYACGDVVRTEALFQTLAPRVHGANMGSAYDRERKLLPILLKNERRGIRVDLELLERDVITYQAALEKADAWLRKELKAPNLTVNSDRELAAALDNAGVIASWTLTPTGQKSVSKKNLKPGQFSNAKVASVLGYRQRLQTCLSTFLEPWLALARENGGRIHTNWNQVRQNHGDESMGGTRTGRLSCSPNFQNIPKNWYDKDDGYQHPKFLRVPELPLVRRYVLPELGHLFGHRDYNQQELRILAHFEDGRLLAAYQATPRMDVHEFVRQAIMEILGRELDRRPVKILNFGMMYGMGVGKLAEGVRCSVEEARTLKNAQRAALPDLKALENDIKHRGGSGLPIRTWGGRQYLVEPPKMINGVMRSFEYKLLNYLIQGSAADCTKEAIIRYAALAPDNFLVTVHDEINISAPKKLMKGALENLREAMESVEFEVPMLTDAKMGPNWAELEKVK